ncbi:MAG: NADPH-dependent FMN reductase [Actinomycetales bacterium]
MTASHPASPVRPVDEHPANDPAGNPSIAERRPPRLAVVVASTREKRFADTVATWFAEQARTHGGFELDVIDLRDVDLPPLGSAHPKSGRYPERVRAFAEQVGAAHAFVFVTPEYNHGYPASLKLALDSVFAEWNAKPASFVSYGGMSGGLRAVEQLRLVLAELHMVDIRETVALPFAMRMFDEGGSLVDDGVVGASVKVMLDQLMWWTQTLRAGRESQPYAA